MKMKNDDIAPYLVPLLCAAAGDALGAGVEFSGALRRAQAEDREGIGRRFFPYSPFGFQPGELTDDTQMAFAAALAAHADRPDPMSAAGARALAACLAEAFGAWVAAGPPDVGGLTRHALSHRGTGGGFRAWAGGESAGNGSLMRATATLAAGYRGEALLRAAAVDGALTHADPRCVAACVWYVAALDGTLEAPPSACAALWRAALDTLEGAAVVRWLADAELAGAELLGQFEARWPGAIAEVRGRVVAALEGAHVDCDEAPSDAWPTGFVLSSLQQAAWAAHAGSDAADAVRLAVRHGGHDADTIGAIAGGLAGARFGAGALAAFPDAVLDALRLGHRWPGVPAHTGFVAAVRDLLSSRDGTPPT